MLGIHGVRRGGADYYLADLAPEVPVSHIQRWAGTAAHAMGLDGPLDPSSFRQLLDGRQPRTGQPIGSTRVQVTAFDLTFSAPKSVSVLFALGGPDTARQVVAGHADAVAGALSYLEAHGITARRRSGEDRVVVPTSGAAAGLFTHGVNRNGDPHVHSHVVMANLVHGVDGRWSACDWRGLDAHRRAASAVYEAHLRTALTDTLGVRWTSSPEPPEIAGLAPALLGEFSSRSADIRRRLHEVGGHSARAGRISWASTRPAKATGVPFPDLARAWGRRASAIAPPDLSSVLGRASEPRPRLDEHRYGAVISVTPHGGAHRRDVVEALAAAARTGATADGLEHLAAAWVPPAGPDAVGVAEPVHQRRAVGPGNHVLRALGPRPVDPGDHEVWLGAARAIDGYRERWDVGRAAEPLGIDGTRANLAALPPARLADHLRTTRAVDEARARLGRQEREPACVELGLSR
jgi:conjugative relaxase-like TrwC/TraI family protein